MGLTTEMRFQVDLTEATQTESMPNILIAGDANAYEVIVEASRNGEPVDLTGSVITGIGILPGNLSAFAVGSAEGNTARFTMSEDFFVKSGTMTVLLMAEKDDIRYTIFRGMCMVMKSAGSTSVMNTEAFPASALMEAGKNEEARIIAEAARVENYELMLKAWDDARNVLKANVAQAVETSDGYVELQVGVQYDAHSADEAIEQEISDLYAEISALKDAVDDANEVINGLKNSKMDVYQGAEAAGEMMVVDDDGNLSTAGYSPDDLHMDTVYPVGSVYVTESNSNPAELFGGIWEQEIGKVLFGAQEAGQTGGNSTMMLTRDQLPEFL